MVTYINVDEAAQALGCSARNVRLLYNQGRLAGYKPTQRTILIDISSLAMAQEKSPRGRPRLSETYYTVSQAAEELGITESKVRVMIRTKAIPAKKLGRKWVIKLSDLREMKKTL